LYQVDYQKSEKNVLFRLKVEVGKNLF